MTINVDELKKWMKQNSKHLVVGIVLVLVGFAGYHYYKSQPKSIVSHVKPSYSGYDGYGSLTYNSRDVGNEVTRVVYRSAGFTKKQTEELLSNDPVLMTDIRLDPKLQANYDRAMTMLGTIRCDFDHADNLKNGDKVIFRVTSTSSKSPVKSEKKVFTVKGLEKIKTVSLKDFLKDNPVTFKGYNNYASLVLPKDKDGQEPFRDNDEEENLSNGDKVRLSLSESYLEQLLAKGESISPKEITIKVSGLKNITEIENLNDLLAKNDDFVKSKHENTSSYTYAIEKVGDYLKYDPTYSGFFSSDSSEQVRLVTVYKITETYSGKPTVSYGYYGYSAEVVNDKLVTEDAQTVGGYNTEDLENLIASLKTEGYTEYKAS